MNEIIYNRLYMSRKQIFILIVVLIFTLGIRLINIRSNPPGQTYDEIIYLSEAKAIAKFGSDLTGRWHPWQLAPADGWYSELTSTTWVPAFLLFGNDPLVASRITSVLMGSLLPLIIGLIAVRLFHTKDVLLPVVIVTSLNPWLFEFSRMSFDSFPSVFFYFLGLLLLLWPSGWHKLWSIAPFFWGFFQYQGHKPLLVPFVFLAVLFLLAEDTKKASSSQRWWRSQRANLRANIPALLVACFAVVLTVSYLYRLPALSSSVRTENFLPFETETISDAVNEQRRLSLSSPLTTLTTNKATFQTEQALDRLLISFDLRHLFLKGDTAVDLFSVTNYGFLHVVDAVVIVLFLVLTKRTATQRNGLLFIIGLILLGALPNVIRSGTPWVTFRGAFVFLAIAMLAGVALSELSARSKNLRILLLSLYVLATLPFFYRYFFQYPIAQTRHEGFSYRIMANYLERTKTQAHIVIPDRTDALSDYLIVYNNALAGVTATPVFNADKYAPRSIDNTLLLLNCPRDWSTPIVAAAASSSSTVLIVDQRKTPCAPPLAIDTKPLEMQSIVDSGTLFFVYNDSLCRDVVLNPYPTVKSNIFSIEKLDDETFCQTFFTRRD